MPAKSTFGSASVIPYTTSNPVYGISRSLRFNSADSAYLNKTLGSGSRTKFTYSLWFKRTSLTDAYLLAAYFSSTNQTNVQFSSDALQIFSNISGSTSINLITSQLFRDPSAWYHLVVSVDTTHATESNRVIAYLNGSQITSFSTSTYPSQNSNTNYGDSATPNYIGSYGAGSFFNGYITETYFIDGQALTPDSFGYIDSNTMVWQPKRYTGTYGTNGFYLNFSDNSSLTTSSNVGIGKDFSGNTNYWTTNGISINTGAGNDSLVDSPTNYGSDTGLGGEVRGNYSTLNVTDINSSIALVGNGNLEFTQNSNGTIGIRRSTIAITSGKWYFEAVPANVTAFSTQHTIGIVGTDHSLSNYVGSGANGYAYRPDGNKLNNGTATAYGTTTTANTDVIMVAFDADNWKIWFGKNGTWFASGDPVAGTNAAFS
ncbi:MAG: hypothetical protein EBU90_29085, partial [Proteobacteria bacterium]|nr:hypothetical protein [Pseudomonadota bacterium]